MIITVLRRVAGLLIAVVGASTVPFMAPAWACGCGAYSPDEGGHASVPTETALVRYTSGAEDVYLSLTVDSTTKTGALLFPVPDKKATVKAGPKELFDELAELTDPPVQQTGAAGGGAPQAGAPPVTVENRQQIGPLDVVTLSSGDPAALTQWLQDNGFAAKPALATAAKPYTDQGWAFVAVRLRPGTDAAALHGRLDPLLIHFATERPVYPMRLSAMASDPETVRLYVLSDHRTRLDTALRGLSTTWADHLGTDLTRNGYGQLAGVVGDGPAYLTRFDGRLQPAAITDDIHFAAAPSDDPVGSSTVRTTPPHQASGKSDNTGLIVGIVVAAVLVVGLVGIAVRQRRVRSFSG
jgi:hypothetical protein